MEAWLSFLLFILSLSLSSIISRLLLHRRSKTTHPPLLPSPSPLPVLVHIFLHRRSIFEIAPLLRRFHAVHGPIFSLRLFPGARPAVFISDAFLAHAALIHHGAVFAERPLAVEPNIFLTAGNHDISSSHYGPLWRLLRRNLSAQILHPSRIRLFAPARSWALQILFENLRSAAAAAGGGSGAAIVLKESFKYTMFCLMVLMCFGEKLGESEIREIESPLEFLLSIFTAFNVFAVFPAATKVLFRKRWKKIVGARRRQSEVFVPLIRARQERKKNGGSGGGLDYCYVDSLIDLRLPEEGGRELTDDEMVNLCHEFLSAGVDTTTTALEWAMAELVKHQDVQSKLLNEINLVVREEEEGIKEEDLQIMPYLKAVVMEALRRHPPGHYVLPHAVADDVIINGYLIPEGTEVHVAVADVNWDERMWEEPMEFRPERFIAGGDGEGVDITGSKEIKMMPFGAGRRMCPGYGLAILHMEFFLANLVRAFEWKVEGDGVDLSEKLEFTTIMENPLRAQIIPRRKMEGSYA